MFAYSPAALVTIDGNVPRCLDTSGKLHFVCQHDGVNWLR